MQHWQRVWDKVKEPAIMSLIGRPPTDERACGGPARLEWGEVMEHLGDSNLCRCCFRHNCPGAGVGNIRNCTCVGSAQCTNGGPLCEVVRKLSLNRRRQTKAMRFAVCYHSGIQEHLLLDEAAWAQEGRKNTATLAETAFALFSLSA